MEYLLLPIQRAVWLDCLHWTFSHYVINKLISITLCILHDAQLPGHLPWSTGVVIECTSVCLLLYIILKVGKWPAWGLLTYSLVWLELGLCRQVTLCKALHCGTSSSFIDLLTNQINEM